MKLKKGERVVTAWPEDCHGSGWNNPIVWVLVRDSDNGKLRIECLQPDEQIPEIIAIREFCEFGARRLTQLVKGVVER